MGESGVADPKVPSKSLTVKQKLPQYYAAVVVTISSLSAGCALGWTSPLLLRLQGDSGTYKPLQHPLSDDEASWVGSLLTIGAILGPILGGIFVDRFGRKMTIIALGGLPAVIGWIITLVATSPGTIYAARILAGISTGSALTVGPAYIAESASPSERGTLCSLPQLMITIGIMLQYAIGPFVSYHALSGMDLVFPIIFIVGCFFLPESPYYLLAVDRKKEAEESLVWFRGGGVDVSSELEDISVAIDESGIRGSNIIDSMKNVFGTRGNRRAILLSCGIMFLQQFSGINAVLFNAEPILSGSGQGGSSMKGSTATMIVGAVQIFASWGTTILVDRAGRRPLLIISCGVTAVALYTLGTHSYLEEQSRASGLGWLPVTSLIVYIISYCLGLGPLAWVVLSELFPSKAKSAAGMFAGSFCWLLGFVVTRTFEPISVAAHPYGAYWLYASCTLAGVAFITLLLPETKCKSLEQIQKELSGH
ncbi:facilitated trehalose transporter Tret1-like [Hetaerina americana]|uniref:facilitated trehalose transporter Tret1-like n=1 Tax=Hetaerina americana TaxID=62018 RepID=UPI003A7F617C